MNELRLLGATDIVVSTNVPVKADGLLYADNKRLDDPGIAVYFKYKKKSLVMARDGFVSVAGNLRSLTLAIDGMRQLERHGGSLMLEKAFTGFLAIAPPDWKKPWREVFGIKPDWSGDIEKLYREKARIRHPDAGGNDTLMAELNVAYDDARQELRNGSWQAEHPSTTHQRTQNVSASPAAGFALQQCDQKIGNRTIQLDPRPTVAVEAQSLQHRDQITNRHVLVEVIRYRCSRSFEGVGIGLLGQWRWRH
jgi:hypothetical protein